MSTIPTQIRCMDPFADHRYSSTINYFTRLITGGQDLIIPFNNNTLNMSIVDATSISITPGIIIKDDVLIHLKETTTLDFKDTNNYVSGSDTNFGAGDATSKYIVSALYVYSRTIPEPQLSIVIDKSRTTFLSNRSLFVYLGTVTVLSTDGGTISEISYTDIDELNGDAEISRPVYSFRPHIIDGGEI